MAESREDGVVAATTKVEKCLIGFASFWDVKSKFTKIVYVFFT